MAIDTINEKFALIAFGRTTDPMMLPVSGGSIGQDDQQQFLWGYPGLLWAAGAALEFVLDLNTRIAVFLRDLYTEPAGDTTTMATRYMATLSGDANARFHRMIQDATDAMS
jgi:hypothetical protein